MEKFYTVQEVADRLGVTRQTIHRLAKRFDLYFAKSRYDRRERAISQAQLDFLTEVLKGSPQPMEAVS